MAALGDDWQNGGFGLYVHWPFCAAKCPYCDFNSHVSAKVDYDAWENGLISEIKRVASETQTRVLSSIFFGGGTPSLMPPHLVGNIIAAAQQSWHFSNDIEITLEANPTSVEAQKFLDFRAAGVNRVSMGIQALNDPDLKRLGRMHSASEAIAAFDVAQNTFDRVSFDLIYGRQGQNLADWEAELTQALALSVDHLSLYQLTIEDGTAFGDRYNRGRLLGLPSEDLGADMYALTQDVCEDAGMPAYEVSNHAMSGAESKHNQIYWRYGDYVGIGPGAHGRLTVNGAKLATEQFRMPAKWLRGIGDGNVELPRINLTSMEQSAEFLMMGLRLREGICLNRYEAISGIAIDSSLIDELVALGMVSRSSNRLAATRQGFMVLNAVLAHLLQD